MFYFHSQCGSTVAMSTAVGKALFGAKYLTNGYRYGQSYYRRRIRTAPKLSTGTNFNDLE